MKNTVFTSITMALLLVVVSQPGFSQANNNLSNLDTTRINESLVPVATDSVDLGSPSNPWRNLYLYNKIFIGTEPVFSIADEDNLYIGQSAGISSTGGEDNVFIGADAGHSNTEGEENIYIGSGAGYSCTDGEYNTFVGRLAGYSDVAPYNSFFGKEAGYFTTSGHSNTFIGYRGGYYNTLGKFNTTLGYSAGHDLTTGNRNVILGHLSDIADGTLSSSIAIGNGTIITASNQARFGSSTTTSIGGYVEWSNISDGRFKKNVNENVKGLEFIMKLRPVTYNLDITGINNFQRKNLKMDPADLASEADEQTKADIAAKEKIVYTGFVAQEVEQAAKQTGYDFSGIDAPKNGNDLYGLRYSEFVVPLVKAVQEQQSEISQKDAQITSLQDQLTQVQAELDQIKTALNLSSTGDESRLGNFSQAKLEQNQPNPFNSTTTIRYQLPDKFQSASILITAQNGSLIKTINLSSGIKNGSVTIQGRELTAGTYLYTLMVDGNQTDSKQMVLTK